MALSFFSPDTIVHYNVVVKRNRLNPKGQLISKCLFRVFNSPKNERTKFDMRYHDSSVECFCSFVSFLVELKITKRNFEIN